VVKDGDGIMAVAFSKPVGPSLKYSRATKTSMGKNLLAADPYERRTIVCRNSGVVFIIHFVRDLRIAK
jgi:hypothetical protein